jgi:prophage regulatory protein
MKVLRIKKVVECTGESRATIYNRIREGLSTRQVKMGPCVSVWPSDEVEQIVSARVAGCGDDEVRELVKDLHARRQKAKPVIRAVTRDAARKEDGHGGK